VIRIWFVDIRFDAHRLRIQSIELIQDETQLTKFPVPHAGGVIPPLSRCNREKHIFLVIAFGLSKGCDLLFETVDNSNDNSEHVETGDSSSIFSGLALGVVEVSGNGDDSVGDGASK
jgi:hypothetical protein